MSTEVFLAVLLAALLHASWNAAIKLGRDRFQGMMLLSLGHGVVGLGMVLANPLPARASLGFLAASVAFHLLYKSALTAAYGRGDLSRVYPIARGVAPMLVLAATATILGETLSAMEVLGVLLVGFGILLLARGTLRHGEDLALIPFALLSAAGTAGYSIFDGLGARASQAPSGYVGWLFLLDAALFMAIGLAWRGRAALPEAPRAWALGLGAGALSVAAYWIAVLAMTVAPIALVTALRETSVLFAVAIGILFLRERADAGKIVAALVIVLGVVLTRL